MHDFEALACFLMITRLLLDFEDSSVNVRLRARVRLVCHLLCKEGGRKRAQSTSDTACIASNIHAKRNMKTDGIGKVEKREDEEKYHERGCRVENSVRKLRHGVVGVFLQ